MFNKFYKKRKKNYDIKHKIKKINKINNNQNIIVKFCVFAGRKMNMDILNKYIILLLNENIIDQYHIFDFTRNLFDKKNLTHIYEELKQKYIGRIFIHNNENTTILENNQYDWSPFYNTISNEKFYKNSIIIKCDDDILFIDAHGLKNAIIERKKDKKSFLFHSNCINNNICSYYQQDLFPTIKEKLNDYPTGGILGPIFENPLLAYIMQQQFLHDCLNDINKIEKYYLKNIYINTRISINFIILNGEDCKYFKNTSLDDEYEVSSYYPEKLLRPNKIIGNFITCHYSYSLQEKILLKKKELKLMYNKFFEIYNNNYKHLNFNYTAISLNKYKINKISNNKFYIINNVYNSYLISTNNKFFYIDYESDKITLNNKKKTYFSIDFIEKDKIIIKLGIYKLNRYNISDNFKNRNLLIKLLYNDAENIIQLIPKDNYYILQFFKSKLYLSSKNNYLTLTDQPKTLWKINKYSNEEKIYAKRVIKNKKIYYKNLKNNHLFTNFYLGWGNENILTIY